MAMAACTLSASPGGAVATRQAAVRCSSRPHGEPSGVCTGHMKPQESGSSLRTAVVRSSAKYAPRWMQRKCDRYLRGAAPGGFRLGSPQPSRLTLASTIF